MQPVNWPVITEQIIATIIAALIIAFVSGLSRQFRQWAKNHWREILIAVLSIQFAITLVFLIRPPRTPTLTEPTEAVTSTAEIIPEQATAIALLQEASQWPEAYAENFSNREAAMSQWFNAEYSYEDRQINYLVEEQYRWEIRVITDTTYYFRDTTSFGSAPNFSVEVEVQQVSGSNCAAGLIFRNTQEGEIERDYYFQIYEGSKEFAFAANELESGLVDVELLSDTWVVSPYIKTDEPNSMRVIAQAEVYTFYINGNYVGKHSDSRLKNGVVGLMASAFGKGDCVVLFDNFKAYTSLSN